MENSFVNLVGEARSILILLPSKPFFDQVAAALSLYLSLRNQKDIQIYSPNPMTVEFNRLIGVNRIGQELGNKNLVIRFVDYKANDIERVSYDIENGQFKLSVIPKEKVTPPSKEQIDLSYSGISADTVILIGGTNDSHFPVLSGKELASARLIHIGNRDINLSEKNVISFSRPAPSTSEIVAGILKENGLAIDQDIATNLLMGIEDATNNFTDPGVSAETFEYIAELMRLGGRRGAGTPAAQDYPPGAIPGMAPRSYAQSPAPKAQLQRQSSVEEEIPSDTDVQEEPMSVEDEGKAPEEWLKQPKIFKGSDSGRQ